MLVTLHTNLETMMDLRNPIKRRANHETITNDVIMYYFNVIVLPKADVLLPIWQFAPLFGLLESISQSGCR